MKRDTYELASSLRDKIESRESDLQGLRRGHLEVQWDTGRLSKNTKRDYDLLEGIKKDLIAAFEREILDLTREFDSLSEPTPTLKEAKPNGGKNIPR